MHSLGLLCAIAHVSQVSNVWKARVYQIGRMSVIARGT
jgi:hypothetical protein